MSENTKIILKPKVRFSQFSDNEQAKGAVTHYKDKIILRAGGPKIKSIVPLKKPVKIVDPKVPINTRDIPLSDSEAKIPTCSKNIQNMPLFNGNISKDETSKILRNANDIPDRKENGKISQFDKDTRTRNNTLRNCRKNSQQKGKENKDTMIKRIVSNKNMTETRIKSSQHTQSVARGKSKHSTSNIDTQKISSVDSKSLKMTKKLQSVPNITKRKTGERAIGAGIFNAKPATSNVTPCYKYTKPRAKSKVSVVKKTALRNVSSSTIKAYVEPGVSHKFQDDAKTGDANKKCISALDITAEKLAQPEYNSIMCTVNKFKELTQQKIVTDIGHLPTVQKNLVNEKISTALDFSLDEVIFKNLVDLSIDDKQLPSAITRSKDPEPRQKDIVPKLSDFFVPEHAKEICAAVQVKPRHPKTDENWNISKISDKILDWRCRLDNA